MLEHLRKWFRAWKRGLKEKEVKECNVLTMTGKTKNKKHWGSYSAELATFLKELASLQVFPLSCEVQSDAPVVLLRRLRTWTIFINKQERQHSPGGPSSTCDCHESFRGRTDRWCLRTPPSVRAAEPAGKPHRCSGTEPGSEWLTRSPSEIGKTCSTNRF